MVRLATVTTSAWFSMGLDAYQAVLEVAGSKNVPVIMDVDLGHLPPMMPVVVGSMGNVKVNGNLLKSEN